MRVIGPTRSAWPTPPRTCGSTPRSPRTCPAAAGSGSSASPARWASRSWPPPRARARPVDVRLGRQPGRRVGQRPAAVLGDRPAHRRRAAVPGDVRQPAQVRPAGAPARAHEADRRGEERAARRAGAASRPVAEPIDDAGVKALFEQAGVIRVETLSRAVRHRAAAGLPAAARGPPGRGRRQLDRARGAGRRRAARRGAGAGRSRRRRCDVGAAADRRPSRARSRRRSRRGGRAEPAATDAELRRPPWPSGRRRDRPSRGAADALVAVFVPPVATRGRPTPGPCGGGRRVGKAGRRGVPGRRGRARRAGGHRRGRRPRARVRAQLPQPRAGRGRAGPGAPVRAVAGAAGRGVRRPARGRHGAGPRAGGRLCAGAAPDLDPTTRRWSCSPATASRSPSSGGPAASTRPSPSPRSSVTRSRSRRWASGGGTAATCSGSGSTSSPRPGSGGPTPSSSRLSGVREVFVQRMAPQGVSCVLEIVDDPSFGSLLTFGLSGMATELLGDRAYRVVPVSDQDAAALVRAPRAAPLLAGYRGAEPARLEALEELVLRRRQDRRGPAGGALAPPRPGARVRPGRVRRGRPGRPRPAAHPRRHGPPPAALTHDELARAKPNDSRVSGGRRSAGSAG